ncbi:MAG: rhodanese-like domain-containing protein [Deltaproteobacteria bacterium]|nr:rhodanese-like domain-containing protein [Deltaproteobacteria bacterium]
MLRTTLSVSFALSLLAACGSDPASPCANGNCRDAALVEAGADAQASDGAASADLQQQDGQQQADALSVDGQAYAKEDITPQTLKSWIDGQKSMTLIDVREPGEFAAGHIKGAINLSWTGGGLKANVGQIPAKLPVVVYCQSGARSSQASAYLVTEGFRPVYDAGGFSAWTGAGYPVEK